MTEPVSTSYFHMSASELAAGTTVAGNGRDKVDARIEDALDKRKPTHLLGRRHAVYFRQSTDFSRCGIANAGYIYRVEIEGQAQIHHLSWIGEMQKALIKAKYPDRLEFRRYPDWTDELLESCSQGYWGQGPSGDPVWEGLSPSFVIAERLSAGIVEAARSSGGWRPETTK